MDYLVEIKNVPESKPLLDHLRSLKYVTIKDGNKKTTKKYHFTDEEMAMPTGKKPNKQEFEEWLIRPDKDKGSKAESVRNRLKKKLVKEFPPQK